MVLLETDRLFLRGWVPDDWKRFQPLATDPRVLRHIDDGKPLTDEAIQGRIRKWSQAETTRGWTLWPVIHRADAELIGFCGFYDGFAPDVEIGWRLLPSYWGQGLATEAAQAVLQYGFRRWAFPRVISVAQPANLASIRIMHKLGMHPDGSFLHEGIEVVRHVITCPHSSPENQGPSELHIRPYLETDEAEVISLWQTVFPDNPSWNVPAEDIRRKLPFQRDLFLVATRGNSVVATTMAGFDGHRGWLHLVAIHPGHQGEGIGRAVLQEAEARLRGIGCTKVNLQVRSTNTDVVKFYERLGYAAEDRVSMGKRLV